MFRPLVAAALVAALPLLGGIVASAQAAEGAPTPPAQRWSFDGVFGTYDRAALQRGFQVYKEVCAACHPVKHLFFRNLTQLGYTEDQVKGIAAEWPQQVTDGPDDNGQMFQRPARPSDPIPGSFANDQAARAANNGALPPDLSLVTKARVGGPDYVHGVLIGYKDAPPDVKMNANMHYNEFFPGHQIAMPPPLNADQVKFADGAPSTVNQMALDVTNFLSWAAEPTLEDRHRTGFKVILFLVVGTGVFYAAKRKIWSRIRH
jgi:ubiquinol-cytochrome c reductase cytochrome c1 subunit